LDSTRAAWRGTDDVLLAQSSEWAKSLTPKFGFEHGLVRDITSLSKYLITYPNDPDISVIARGGLLYILQPASTEGARLGDFGLLDDAFVLAYAVHEIRNRLGEA